MNTVTSEACGKTLHVTCHMHSCPLDKAEMSILSFSLIRKVIFELLYLPQLGSSRAHCLTLKIVDFDIVIKLLIFLPHF